MRMNVTLTMETLTEEDQFLTFKECLDIKTFNAQIYFSINYWQNSVLMIVNFHTIILRRIIMFEDIEQNLVKTQTIIWKTAKRMKLILSTLSKSLSKHAINIMNLRKLDLMLQNIRISQLREINNKIMINKLQVRHLKTFLIVVL